MFLFFYLPSSPLLFISYFFLNFFILFLSSFFFKFPLYFFPHFFLLVLFYCLLINLFTNFFLEFRVFQIFRCHVRPRCYRLGRTSLRYEWIFGSFCWCRLSISRRWYACMLFFFFFFYFLLSILSSFMYLLIHFLISMLFKSFMYVFICLVI